MSAGFGSSCSCRCSFWPVFAHSIDENGLVIDRPRGPRAGLEQAQPLLRRSWRAPAPALEDRLGFVQPAPSRPVPSRPVPCRPVRPSVCLSACLAACLPACLPGWLAGWLAGWLSVCLSVCLSLSVCLCLSLFVSVCPCLSLYQFVFSDSRYMSKQMSVQR